MVNKGDIGIVRIGNMVNKGDIEIVGIGNMVNKNWRYGQ